MAATTAAVACGELTTAEAGELSRLVESYVKTFEVAVIERRLRVLEQEQTTMRRELPRRIERMEQRAVCSWLIVVVVQSLRCLVSAV